MKIDPLQPILYDNDTSPGVGAGWWQVNPFAAQHRDSDDDFRGEEGGFSIKPRTLWTLQAIIVGGVVTFIAVGWLAPFF